MALKKVKRPVTVKEEEVKEKEDLEEEVTKTEEEVKEEKESPKKKTIKKETKKSEPKEEKESPKKKETKKKEPKLIKPKKLDEVKEEREEGQRATKKRVIKLTQKHLEETEGITLSLEDITKIVNSFEEVLIDVTNTQSYKFLNGMIRVQERNGQVFKSPKVDYYSYKAPRTVKTLTVDTENVPKYKGDYDEEKKVFTSTHVWDYEAREFVPHKEEFNL